MEQPEEDLNKVEMNMSDNHYDFAVGFMPNPPEAQKIIPNDPSLITIEVIERSDFNYSGDIKENYLELERCVQNSFREILDPVR